MTKRIKLYLLGMLVLSFVVTFTQNSNAAAGTTTTTFTAASIAGAYGLTFNGSVINAAGSTAGTTSAFAGTGQVVFDGKSAVTGSETFNLAGTVCTGTITGTYTVNSDGVATIMYTFSPTVSGTTPAPATCPSSSQTHSAVIVNGGQQIYFAETDADRVVTGSAQKQ